MKRIKDYSIAALVFVTFVLVIIFIQYNRLRTASEQIKKDYINIATNNQFSVTNNEK